MRTDLISSAIAVKIQQAVLRNVVNTSDVSLNNLTKVIEQTLAGLMHISKLQFMAADMPQSMASYNEQLAHFKHQSAHKFAEEIFKKGLIHHWAWNPSPGFDCVRRNELTLGVLDMNKVNEILE